MADMEWGTEWGTKKKNLYFQKIKKHNAGGDSSWARGLWMGMSLGGEGVYLSNNLYHQQ
jgi:hypothetical protein